MLTIWVHQTSRAAPLRRNKCYNTLNTTRRFCSQPSDWVRSFNVTTDQRTQFQQDGFLIVRDLLSQQGVKQVLSRFESLFAGKFDTGVFPDEWHWREGISKPNAVREIVNTWKSDNTIAKVALSNNLSRVASQLMDWNSVRIAQEELLWKVPRLDSTQGQSEVAYHQDSAYISTQFRPLKDNSVTIWIALDEVDEENGVVEYATGSHKWQSTADDSFTNVSQSTFHGGSHTRYDDALRMAQQSSNDSKTNVVKPRLSPGDASFHHPHTWHGSGPNRSTVRHRRALAVHLLQGNVMFRSSPPADYIYGRYQMFGSLHLDESFFPFTFRSEDDYVSPIVRSRLTN